MPKVEVVVKDTVISSHLKLCIKKCLSEISAEEDSGKIVTEVIHPEHDRYVTDGVVFHLSQISYGSVYCVFCMVRYSLFALKKRKELLFAISEPEVVFTESGDIGLSDIVVYAKNESIRKVLVPIIEDFAEYFKIKNIRVVLDTVESEN